jgi:hypothetical protein
MTKKLDNLLEREKKIKAQIQAEKAKMKAAERKARNHRLIQVAAILESEIGQAITEEDFPKWQRYCHDQKDWINRALDRES